MELSQENSYVVECYKNNFIEKSKGRVIIYGLGVNTRAILEMLGAQYVAGLMDAACEGKKVMGLPVYSLEEAVQHGDCVVIVARNSVVPIIFERIRILEERWEFPIYNIRGERIIEKKEKPFKNDSAYWKKSMKELLESIRKHDVISFDIFDTLIIRKCMLPTDVFDLAEAELKKKGINANGFAVTRREVEMQMKDRWPMLKDIYEGVRREMDWTEECCRIAYNLELEIESKVCIPRITMCNLYRDTLKSGKRVILTSDMYLSSAEIEKLLKQCGIFGYDKLFISCEEKADKESGKLYDRIKLSERGTILHIGDNAQSDGEMAKKYKVDSFVIWSPYEMLVQSSLSKILSYADSLEKRNCVGRIQGALFDDPFVLGAEKGLVTIKERDMTGYVFLAPIVSCFLFFLADELKKQGIDKILFCARDGYIIWKLYQKYVEQNKKDGLPEGIYFKTSRRAITVASIETEEDILFILEKPYNTTLGELLWNRFGIKHDENDWNAEKKAVSTENANEVKTYILKYKEKILSNAEKERDAYLKYMQQNHIANGDKIGIYDFCSGGTIQYYFKKLTGKAVRGIYFATVNFPNKFFKSTAAVSTLFGNISQYELNYHLAAHYMYLEAVFTDQYGTLIQFDSGGAPVYDEAENSRRDFKAIEEIQRGIYRYFDELLGEGRDMNYGKMKEFADKILGCFFQPEKCRISDELKNVVKAESAYDFLKAYSAWNEE